MRWGGEVMVVSRKLMEVWDCWCVNLILGWKELGVKSWGGKSVTESW